MRVGQLNPKKQAIVGRLLVSCLFRPISGGNQIQTLQTRTGDGKFRVPISHSIQFPGKRFMSSFDVKPPAEVVSGLASPEAGKYFDLVSCLKSCGSDFLVRKNGGRVSLRDQDHFKGRYVMVCSFEVPIADRSGKLRLQSLANLCNELYSTRDDFEMVIVARMSSAADHEAVFNCFHESCLTVPFEDSKQLDYVCNQLGFRGESDKCLLLMNRKGIVLSCPYKDRNILEYYGAEAFPFTENVMTRIYDERFDMEWLDCSLEKMLTRRKASSPATLYRLNPGGGPREELPVSELEFETKHVGLYLCCEGGLMLRLIKMYEQCREKNLDFEIVVIYLPFEDVIDPKAFREKIEGLMRKHNIFCWWCLPFDNSVSRRFWGLTSDYVNHYHSGPYDKLIMLGPLANIGMDIYGADVMKNYGIKAFPFTIGAVVEMRVKEVRKNIRLESLLRGKLSRGNNKNDVMPLNDLKGKKVILYAIPNRIYQDLGCFLKRLSSIYHQINSEARDFEMVIVDNGEILSEMPCYVCSYEESVKELVDLCKTNLVGFDEDGKVCLFLGYQGGETKYVKSVEYYEKNVGELLSIFSSNESLCSPFDYEFADQVLGFDEY